MERARKMVIVPEETLQRLRNAGTTLEPVPAAQPQQQTESNTSPKDPSIQTTGNNLSRLDSEMHDIIHSKTIADEYEKYLKYLQVLRRYLFFKEDERSIERQRDAVQRGIKEIDTVSAPLSDDKILENIPKSYERKAKLLLRHWRTAAPDRLKWDNTGRITLDGKKIEGSDIVELIKDVVKKKSDGRPLLGDDKTVGIMEFAKFIKTSETPRELIGNERVLKIGQTLTNPTNTAKRRLRNDDVASPSSSPVATSTPEVRKNTPKLVVKKKWLRLDI